MTVPSSFVVIVPSPSVRASMRSNQTDSVNTKLWDGRRAVDVSEGSDKQQESDKQKGMKQ
jgi:hypothetical protein